MNTSTEIREYTSRDEIPQQYKWDLTKIYPNWEAWEADIEKIEPLLQKIEALKGKFHQGAQIILQWQKNNEELYKKLHQIHCFCSRKLDTALDNNEYIAKQGKASALYDQYEERLIWITSELLSIPEKTMLQWIDSEPDLHPYSFKIKEIYRTSKRTLHEKDELLLSNFSALQDKPAQIYSTLAQIDRESPPEKVTLKDGTKVNVSPINYLNVIEHTADSEDRFKIQKIGTKPAQRNINVYASIYDAACKASTSKTKVRGYKSALEAKLFENNIPLSVIENLFITAEKAKPINQRYDALRKRVLKIENYHRIDRRYPINRLSSNISYEEAKDLCIQSVRLLGKNYQNTYIDILNNGSIDVFPHKWKRRGASCSSVYKKANYVLLNYEKGDFFGLEALAHEMSHAMHHFYSEQNQKSTNSFSSLLTAEVASLLGELLLFKTVRESFNNSSDKFALLEINIDQILKSFLTQAFFANFEINTHKLSEKGETLTAKSITREWNNSYEKFFGLPIPKHDPTSYEWANLFFIYRIPFYLYNFPLSFSAAANIFKRLTNASTDTERRKTVNQYLDMLCSGGSEHPIDQIKKAGVDLTKPEPSENVIQELDRLVTELESYYPKD
jgi:oligoendopeptidase F